MTTIEGAVEDFLAACGAGGLSVSTTTKNYAYPLRSVFADWCRERGLSDLSDLNQRVLDDFNVTLQTKPGRRGKPLAKWTVQSYVLPVRHMLRWAKRQGLDVTGAEPRRPVVPKGHKEPPTRTEIQRMEDACQVERDRLIIRLMADIGVRNGELRGLRVDDLIERDRRWYLHIRGKGRGGFGVDRISPVPRLYRRLKRYIDSTRPQDASTDLMFLTVRRQRGEYRGFTEVQLENIVRNAALAAGIKRRVYPHLLRAACITWLLSQGMNTFQVSSIVGNFSALETYYHPTLEDSYEALAAIMAAG